MGCREQGDKSYKIILSTSSDAQKYATINGENCG